MKHTKEPWYVVPVDDLYEIYSDSADVVWTIDQITGEANAKRIVACVNACAGITNEALEAGVVACGVNNLRDNIPDGKDQLYFYNVKVFEDDV